MGIVILTQAGKEIRSLVTNHEGKYSVALPPGGYRIEIRRLAGIEFTKDVPATIRIVDGRETRLDIHIDTGVR